MSVSKRAFGVTGYSAQTELQKQQIELAKAFKYLAHAPLNDGAIKRVLAKGAEPLKEAIQVEYLKDDPTKFGGKIQILVIIKKNTKSLDKIYVGPDTKYGRSWKLWQIFQYGHVLKKGGSIVGVVPGKRSIDRAFRIAKNAVISETGKAFQKEMEKYAAKVGFDWKNF